MPWQSRLIRFTAITIAFFSVISVAWYFVAPSYTALLSGAADMFAPARTGIDSIDNTIYITPDAGSMSEWMYGINALDLQYGLLVTVALIAATPGISLLRRAGYIAVTCLLIFLINIISVIVFAHAANSGDPGTVSEKPLVVLFCIVGCDLFPVIIWGIISFRHIIRKPVESDDESGMQEKGAGGNRLTLRVPLFNRRNTT